MNDHFGAIGVLRVTREHGVRMCHRRPNDLVSGAIPHDGFASSRDLGRRDLGVRMVDVVAGSIRQYSVDERGFDLGGDRLVHEVTAGVIRWLFVFEVPSDPATLARDR